MADTPTPGVSMTARDKADAWMDKFADAEWRNGKVHVRDAIEALLLSEREAGRVEGIEEAAGCCDAFDGPPSDSDFVMGQATAAQQIRAAIRSLALTPREEDAGWSIKPLEWVKPLGADTMTKAETIVGTYRVWTHHEANGQWFTALHEPSGGRPCWSADVTDRAEGQAAAQADYEARILSALALPNPPLPASINEMER